MWVIVMSWKYCVKLAVSLVGERHFDTAAYWTVWVLEHLVQQDLRRSQTIININVPDLPLDAIQGAQITRLGRRHMSEPVVCDRDPRGLPIYWIGPAGGAADEGAGTDFHAVAQGYVSITPLQIDLTDYSLMQQIQTWVQ